MQHVERVWFSFGEKIRKHNNFISFLNTVFAETSTLILRRNLPSELSGLPRPGFWFGDSVIYEFYCDDTLDPRCGSKIKDYGIVVGLAYQIPEIRNSDWCYWIRWYKLESSPINLPHTSWVMEREIQLVSKFGNSNNC